MLRLSQQFACRLTKHFRVNMLRCKAAEAVMCQCREKLGWLINSAAAVVFTIILIIVLCRYRYYYNSSGYGLY